MAEVKSNWFKLAEDLATKYADRLVYCIETRTNSQAWESGFLDYAEERFGQQGSLEPVELNEETLEKIYKYVSDRQAADLKSSLTALGFG